MRRKEGQEDQRVEEFDLMKEKRRTRYTQKTFRKKQEFRKSWNKPRGERSEADDDNWSDREYQ